VALAVPAVALSEGGLRLVDGSVPERSEEPGEFTLWHTGEGEAGRTKADRVTYFDTILLTPLE
jgi:hypothetical protein